MKSAIVFLFIVILYSVSAAQIEKTEKPMSSNRYIDLNKVHIERNTVAYVPVAHGIVPWWTEAYSKQEKGDVFIPQDDWFSARVEVIGDEFAIFVNDHFVFEKKLAYYLKYGRPGLFVGTATDVAFRRIRIEDIHKEK